MGVAKKTMRAHTGLQLLHALEGDLELVGRGEGRGVVADVDVQQRHDRHLDGSEDGSRKKGVLRICRRC